LSDDVRREEMSRAGLNRSKQFMWKKAANDLLAIFKSVK